MDETITPGEAEYSALVSKMQAAGVDVFFLGGYHRETGLIFRQAHDRGYDLRLIAYSAMATEDFPMIAGPELEGTLMVATADMRESPRRRRSWRDFARRVTSRWEPRSTPTPRFRSGPRRSTAAGSLDLDAVTEAMHSRQFDTVLGRIGFDAKGDVTGFEPWQWFVWQADGTYVPLEQSTAKGQPN